MKRPRIGAHVAIAGGIENAPRNAQAMGAECLQIFGASPRQWNAQLPSPEVAERFQNAVRDQHLGPVYLHAAYPANLSSSREDVREKSVENLALHLQIGEMLGARGLIFHIGAGKETPRGEAKKSVVEGVARVLEKVPGSSRLLLENSASSKKLGADPKEVGEIFHAIASDRVRVCVDTAHAFEAGIIKAFTSEEVETWLDMWDKEVGLGNIPVLHVNDSKTAFGSENDKHENIGEGYIGMEGFRALAGESRLRDKDWILEVPGFEGKGPDKENVDRLKALFA